MQSSNKRSPRYIGPKVETRLPQAAIDWFDKVAVTNEMDRAEYIREVLMEYYEKESK